MAPAARQIVAETKFRPLKKEMQAVFSRIGRALAADVIPEAETVAQFTRLARLMTRYPGFGDPAYPALIAACEQLEAAVAAGRQEAVVKAVEAIGRQRQDCHQAHRTRA